MRLLRASLIVALLSVSAAVYAGPPHRRLTPGEPPGGGAIVLGQDGGPGDPGEPSGADEDGGFVRRGPRRETEGQRRQRLGHRQQQGAAIRAVLGPVRVLTPEERRVLREHNRVTARLQAIATIAENTNRPELAARAAAAQAKEDARFLAKLKELAAASDASAGGHGDAK